MKTIPCPHCGQQIAPAALLGELARGRKKTYTPEELARRAARLPHRRRSEPQTHTIYEDGEVFHPPCPKCGSRSTDCGCD